MSCGGKTRKFPTAALPAAQLRPGLRVFFGVALLALVLLAGGCTTHSHRVNTLNSAWESADIDRAVRVTSNAADRSDGRRNAVLWHLELGAALRTAGEYEESNRAFDEADRRISEYEEKARVRVGVAAAAAMTNLNALPYEGYAYDKIMLHTYKALNYLALGDLENARVELNRSFQRQSDAVQENARRIEQAREEAREEASGEEASGNGLDVDRSMADERFRSQLDDTYAHLRALHAYADYVNPFAVYLEALYFMGHPWSLTSDLERARVSLERVDGMILENDYVQQDIAFINNLLMGRPTPPTTYVLFETGRGPVREEVRIDLALWGLSRDVPYVGAAFPDLRFRGRHDTPLTVLTSEGTQQTARLASMDSIVAQEFQNEMPVVIAKTLMSTAAKATAQYAASEATRDAGILGALVHLGGIVYQIAMNQADTRMWQTLPKEFHVCRFPTPADRRITLSTPYSSRNIEVEIEPGIVNVVYVKSISRGTPLVVNQFTLQ